MLVAAVLVAGMVVADVSPAQAPGITAKPLLRTSLSGDEAKETVVLMVEVAPGATTGRHKHPGDEYATVLDGTLELRVEGRDSRRVTAGDAYHNARDVIHETRNVGDTPARLAIVFVVEKGRPITQPVP
jgi:quercetin dioxygenase-like cupin family protein